jgi:hypothetical protein
MTKFRTNLINIEEAVTELYEEDYYDEPIEEESKIALSH